MTFSSGQFKKSCLVVLLAFSVWMGTALQGSAQTNNIRLESRVDRLEAEVSRVRSQLTRLEAQVSTPHRSAPPLPSTPARPVNELSLQEQFDNLATLAIELKQDLRQLEARVTDLEQTSGGNE